MTISAGSSKLIDTTNSDSMDCAMISASQMLVVYNDPSSTLAARVLDITTATKTIDTVNAEQSIENYGGSFDRLALIRFSSTKFLSVKAGGGGADTVAQVLNVSGTTVTGGTSLVLTDPASPSSVVLRMLTSTTALLAYQGGFAGTATRVRVLSIDGSDNITEGSSLDVIDTGGGTDVFDVELFSPTSAILAIQDSGDSDFLNAQLVTISGTTVSNNGGVQSINGTDSGDQTSVAMAAISSSEVVVGYTSTGFDDLTCHVVSLSGSTLTPGAALDITSGQHLWPSSAIKTNSTTILFAGASGAVNRTTQVIKDGTTLSYTASEFVDKATTGSINKDAIAFIEDDFALRVFRGSTYGFIIGSDEAIVATPGKLDVALMTGKSADIDADGSFLYIAAINSLTFPTLVKISTALDTDGTTVFDPGSGDNIGVQCGKFDADVVWVAGNFGGTDVVEKSEDAGSSFSVKDDGTFDPVTSFVVGPDSDDRVLIFTDAGGSVASSSIQETIDSGASWEEKNSGLGFVSKAVDRLDINVEEIVTGNEAGASDNIHYSPNTGQDLEDYSTGFPSQNVTKVIVG